MNKGLTLIEVIVVVATIGILSSLVLVEINEKRDGSAEDCEGYRDSIQRNIPARCLNYWLNK